MEQHLVKGVVARVWNPHPDGEDVVVSFTLRNDTDRRRFVCSIQQWPEAAFLRSGDSIEFYAASPMAHSDADLWAVRGWLQKPNIW